MSLSLDSILRNQGFGKNVFVKIIELSQRIHKVIQLNLTNSNLVNLKTSLGQIISGSVGKPLHFEVK